MIHILQSVSNMDRGGIESMLMNYYRHLDRTRFQFDFLVNKKKPGFFDDEIRALGGRIFQSPGVAPQSYPAYLRSMQQLLAQHPEIKVLHAHNEAMQLFALEGAKKAGLPVRIAHAHNTRLPKDAKLPIKWFCKQFIPGAATDYWACGREAGIYYFGQSAWDARGVTLRNAIDLDRFGYRPQVRAKLRAEYGLNDKLVVGCVARLMAQKNHTRLLDIFAALKKVRPDSCLLLVGEGELRAELEAKAARLGITQDVKFLGVQSDTSVWYQAMDVFVMPSLFEGLPVVGIPEKLYRYKLRASGSASQSYHPERLADNFYLSDVVEAVAKSWGLENDPACRRAVNHSRVLDLQLGIKNVCLGPLSFRQRTAWLRQALRIPAVRAAVRDMPLQDARSRNDRIKLALLKMRLCAVVVALSSWNNRR